MRPRSNSAIEVSADGDLPSDARTAAGLGEQLKAAPVERHRVVARDEPRFLVTEDLLEIDRPERDERRRGIGGGAAERRVVVRQKARAQVRIGVGQRRDLGDAQFIDQAVLERPIEPLAAPARLRGVGRDVLNPQARQRPADLGPQAPIDRPLGLRCMKRPVRRSV